MMALRLIEMARGAMFVCGETSQKAPFPGFHQSSVCYASSQVMVCP